ncbi:MAG: Rrf2 family transcriptional regulator [Planctomycetes bacterium]|nr:Rrf2 family transcriptional regulator [Planctomycetota bacterium]
MKLSTRVRYGARAMVDLGVAFPDGTVSVRDIAQREGVSAKYLEQIVSRLKAAGLIVAHRGVQGGYSLARPPASISLNDIYHVLEGDTAPTDCVDEPGACPMKNVCPTRDTWVELKESIENVLQNTSLQDLVERKGQKVGPHCLMYHI